MLSSFVAEAELELLTLWPLLSRVLELEAQANTPRVCRAGMEARVPCKLAKYCVNGVKFQVSKPGLKMLGLSVQTSWVPLQPTTPRPYQFFKTRVVMSAAMTMMRETVMVMI